MTNDERLLAACGPLDEAASRVGLHLQAAAIAPGRGELYVEFATGRLAWCPDEEPVLSELGPTLDQAEDAATQAAFEELQRRLRE